jgi:hypothetical protein
MSTGYYGQPFHGRYRRNPIPPGEGFPVGCGCLVALVVAAPLAWLVGPLIFLTGMVLTVHCVYTYLRRLASVMGVGPWPAAAPIAGPPDTAGERAEPAFTHYLFGPALIDLRHVVQVAVAAPLQVGREYDQRIRRVFQYRSPSWLMVPLGVVVWIGMAGGVIGGFVAIALLGFLQLTVVVALALSVIAAGLALRAIDSAMRRVKGIRTSCPSCHLRVNYPSYECFGDGCGRRHRDVRPGRYGVLKRRCACGTQLPTLLLIGSGDGRMRAYCPHCTEPMSKGAGTVTEVVIPVLGAAATGKTRLMTAMVMGLLEGHTGYGAEAEFVDDESESAYRKLADKLRAGVHTWKTIKAKDAPLRAYSLRVRPPAGAARLFHIFDAPGELVAKSESLRELRYIKAARTFLFTVDLLSIGAVWESLEPRVRARHDQLRSDVPPDFVFGQLVQNIEGHGVQIGRARLAVALTKNDLVQDCAALAGVGEDSEDIRHWLEGPAGLDGMVRAMRLSFAEVRFFRTSSWLEHGEIDDGVLDLVGWILIKEGLRVHHSLG